MEGKTFTQPPQDTEAMPIQKSGGYSPDSEKGKLLTFLKQEGIIQEFDGNLIFDLQYILNINLRRSLREKLKAVSMQKQDSFVYKIYEVLGDIPVVSKTEFTSSQESGKTPVPSPLFNVPESREEAFDVEKIKNKKYHLNFSDLYSGANNPLWSEDLRAKNGDAISPIELTLATKIYRNFSGKRDGAGNLLINDPESGKTRKISATWIAKNIGSFHMEGKIGIQKPKHFLLENCPELLKRELLKLEDFPTLTTFSSGSLSRKEKAPSKKSPYIMINRVNYFIGRENFRYGKESIPIENIKVVLLDNNTAGIVETKKGRSILRFTFPLLSKDASESRMSSIKDRLDSEKGAGNYQNFDIIARNRFNKKELDQLIQPWRPTANNKQRGNETPEQYAERIRHIGDFEFIQQVSEDFVNEAGLGIHNLSWREQQWLCGAAFEMRGEKYQKLLEFGKKFGLTGLKTFLSCEYDLQNGVKILAISEKLPPESADAIFAKYAELADAASELNNNLASIFSERREDPVKKEEINKMTEALLATGKDLLISFAQKLEKGEDLDPKKILEELEQLKVENEVLARAFREVSRNHPEISFDQFTGVKLRWTDPKEITAEMKMQMAKITQDNYSDMAERKIALAGIKKGLHGKRTVFGILKHKEEIIAFSRFDREEFKSGQRHLPQSYWGSFNVARNMRGHFIGEQMMKEFLDEEADGNIVMGHAFPYKEVTSRYVERSGFIITDIIFDPESGLPLLEITRDDAQNKSYIFRRNMEAAREEIEKRAEFGANPENGEFSLITQSERTTDPSFWIFIKNLIKKYNLTITRYFPNQKDNPEWMYLAFEPRRNKTEAPAFIF